MRVVPQTISNYFKKKAEQWRQEREESERHYADGIQSFLREIKEGIQENTGFDVSVDIKGVKGETHPYPSKAAFNVTNAAGESVYRFFYRLGPVNESIADSVILTEKKGLVTYYPSDFLRVVDFPGRAVGKKIANDFSERVVAHNRAKSELHPAA